MKLSLGAVLAPLLAVGIAMISGCAGVAASAAAGGAASMPVGTTSITSATLAPSSLAAAAWDGDEASAAPAPRLAPPTWGTAVVDSAPAN